MAIFCVASSAIVFAISNSKIGADVNTVSTGSSSSSTSTTASKIDGSQDVARVKPNYIVVSDGTRANLIMVDVTNTEITNFTYFSTSQSGVATPIRNYGIEKSYDDAKCGGIRRTDGYCYIFVYNNLWDRPAVLAPVSPSWIFLKEIMSRTTGTSDTTGIGIIQDAMTSFAGEALRVWNGVDMSQIREGSGQIIIRSSDLINKIGAEKLSSSDPYVTVSSNDKNNNSGKTVTVKLDGAYPLATKNSLWLASVDTVLGSVIDVWQAKPFKVGLEDKRTALMNHRSAYNNYADVATSESNASGNVLKVEGPGQIITDADGNATTPANFKMTIDAAKFLKPASGYKTQIYVKPSSKNGADVFTYLHSSDPEYSFSWSDILSSPYATSLDGSGNPVAYNNAELGANGDMSYDKKFPQKYTMTIITYMKDDAGKEIKKETISTNFDTVNNSFFGQTPQTDDANVPGGGTISISVDRSAFSSVTQGPVNYTVKLHDANADKVMRKIVVWVCSGTASAVVEGDSETCVGGGQEQVKAAFILEGITGSGQKFSYDSGGNTTLQGTWDISGTSPGTYSVMAKAHSAASGGYVTGSKVAVTVSITNSAISENTPDEQYANILDFGGPASGKAKGSTLRTVTDVANRVVNILLSIIGAFSVIAIIVGGIFYISSGGDPAKAEKGKKTVIYAVYGIVIATLGFFIMYIVKDLINQILK